MRDLSKALMTGNEPDEPILEFNASENDADGAL